jgi:hypothetical protein
VAKKIEGIAYYIAIKFDGSSHSRDGSRAWSMRACVYSAMVTYHFGRNVMLVGVFFDDKTFIDDDGKVIGPEASHTEWGKRLKYVIGERQKYVPIAYPLTDEELSKLVVKEKVVIGHENGHGHTQIATPEGVVFLLKMHQIIGKKSK